MHRFTSLAVAIIAVGLLSLVACGQDDDKQTDPTEDNNGLGTYPSNLDEIDFTFVVDDSGSMCDEQDRLARGFSRFVLELANEPVDFHIGVTSTSADADGRLGTLNTRPNPIPTQTEGCDVSSQLVEQQLERAIACTRSPADFEDVVPLSGEQRTCIDEPADCTIADFEIADLFPAPEQYREIPAVLKREDYRQSEGTLDVRALKADFQCLTLVGTSGSDFEKGFGALIDANSPELVGRVYEADADDTAPNYGLVRQDSRAAAVFVTDENDCTYSNDGASRPILEDGPCGDEVCHFAASSQLSDDESPLLSPSDVQQKWVEHLRTVKSRSVTTDELWALSVHGQPQRYDGAWPQQSTCEAGSAPTIEPTCRSEDATARSGDRYQRFLALFAANQRYPRSRNPIQGQVCTDGFFDWLGPPTIGVGSGAQ